jgi:hypothetical protein
MPWRYEAVALVIIVKVVILYVKYCTAGISPFVVLADYVFVNARFSVDYEAFGC